MNIRDLPAGILLCRDAKIASFVWGHRGLGKSECHKEICFANDWGFIDFRGSQMEASDIRGLPLADMEALITRFLPPSDLPAGHGKDEKCPTCSDMTRAEAKAADIKDRDYCRGLLFLDEINRSEDDVLQAIFQLVLDRKIGEYELPDGWSVHCAGNFAKGYNTNNFKDPAFLDRFCHITLGADNKYCESWMGWMSTNYPEADKIMQFVGVNDDHLIGQVEGDLGFTIQPSPRSWEMVAKIERACQESYYPDNVKHTVIAGLIGNSLALMYQRFTCEITPKDIMKNGVDPHRQTLTKLSRNALIGLTHGIASKCQNQNMKDRKKSEMNNICDYMLFLCKERDRDLAVALGRRLAGQESALDGAMLTNPKLAAIARRFLDKSKKINGESWIKTITSYPELANLMQKVSWGK